MDEKIVSLLNNNLRVIIPDFGAFIIRQQEPRIVVFNEMLKNDDGLLLDYIIKKENVEPEIAVQLLSDYTNQALRILESGNVFTIQGLGNLQKDRHGNIVFKQEATGSPSGAIVSHQVTEKDGETRHTLPEKNKTEPVRTPTISLSKKEISKPWQNFFTKQVINWIVIILTINLVVIFIFVIKNSKADTAKAVKPAGLDQTVLNQLSDSVRSAAADTTLVYKASATGDDINPATVSSGIDIRYFIVAGCFRDEINADELVDSLKILGYKAEKFGKIGDLYAVSFASFNNKETAVNELARIRKQHHPEAWMTRF